MLPTSINVRVSDEEKAMAEKLAKYLFKLGKIEKETLSDAMRLSLRFTVGELLKAIEADRYRG